METTARRDYLPKTGQKASRSKSVGHNATGRGDRIRDKLLLVL